MAMGARLVIGYWDAKMGAFDGIHEGNGALNENIVSFLWTTSASCATSSASEEARENVIEVDIAKTGA